MSPLPLEWDFGNTISEPMLREPGMISFDFSLRNLKVTSVTIPLHSRVQR